MSERSYAVPGISCEHCVRAITDEVARIPGVTRVAVDLDAKRVTVAGDVADAPIRDAIEEAGYDVA